MRWKLSCVVVCAAALIACDDGGGAGGSTIILPTGDAGVDAAPPVVEPEPGPNPEPQPSVEPGPNPEPQPGVEPEPEPEPEPRCRIRESVTRQAGEVVTRTRYRHDADGDYTAETDRGDDGVIDSRFALERVAEGHTRTRIDADGDGEYETVSETWLTWSEDDRRLEQRTETQGPAPSSLSATSVYLSADRDTPEGLLPQQMELDLGDDGSVDDRTVRTFRDGRLVEETTDSHPARFPVGEDTAPDGEPEIVRTFSYAAGVATTIEDQGRVGCSDGQCEVRLPDGEPDAITERRYGPDGRPEMLWAGRPLEERSDFDADGTWDRIVDRRYGAYGELERQRVDDDADGTWDTVTEQTYDCE